MLRLAGLVVLVLVMVAGAAVAWRLATADLIVVRHLPPVYPARTDPLTVNVVGKLGPLTEGLEWRLGDGAWSPGGQAMPRAEAPDFLIEIPAGQLAAGENRLTLRATGPFGRTEERELVVAYDPAPVELPRTAAWTDAAALESQTGIWETFAASDGTLRVRSVPGEEGWDRILMVTGAFPGGRRVRTDVTFHGSRGLWPPVDLPWRTRRKHTGFGIFPLWGGNPDEPGRMPRRGWRFSLVWWFGTVGEVSTSFSQRFATDRPDDHRVAREQAIEEGRRYAILAEVWPEKAPDGSHRRWVQRMKWWPADQPEPEAWLEASDGDGPNLPAGDYAVALISLNAAVDFGPVTVEPFAGPASP